MVALLASFESVTVLLRVSSSDVTTSLMNLSMLAISTPDEEEVDESAEEAPLEEADESVEDGNSPATMPMD